MDLSSTQESQSGSVQVSSYDISHVIEDRLQFKLIQMVLDDIHAWCHFLEPESNRFRLDDVVPRKLHGFLKEIHRKLTDYLETSRKLYPNQLIHLSNQKHPFTMAYPGVEVLIEKIAFFELEKLHYAGLFRIQRHNLACIIEELSQSRQSQNVMTQENQVLSSQIKILQERLQTLSNNHCILENQNLCLQQYLGRQEQEIENLKAHLLIEITSTPEPANQPSQTTMSIPFDMDDDQIRDRYRSLIGKSEQLERHLDRLLLNRSSNSTIKYHHQQTSTDLFPIPLMFRQEITSVMNEETF